MKIAASVRAMSIFTLVLHRSSAFSVSRKSLHGSSPLLQRSLSSLAVSADVPSTEDQSAAANSRAPFRMPRQSANDSSYSSADGDSKWSKLGLWTELTECIDQDLKLEAPTAVQALVLPKLLQTTETAQHIAFLAATGSGKTLAYSLPVMQMLKHQEVFGEVKRHKQRPRAVILAPTRELAAQITSVLKQLSHSIKLSVRAVTGNDSVHKQRKYLIAREVDVLVATPGRLIQHVNDRTVLLNKCKFVVLDEMDTMIEQGFGNELARLLHPVLYHKNSGTPDPETELVESAPSVWLTSATMTQSIQKMIGDTSDSVNAKRHYVKKKSGEEDKGSTSGLVLPRMEVVRAPGLHKVVPKLEQVFVDVGNVNKLSLLVDLVCSESDKQTLIFCNTANSCRAVEYALSEARLSCLSYHGDLNSIARAENFDQFRKGTSQLLVCTDLAARGLDVPTVQHVIMFDFPLNALDYLHRSGRTARGMNAGKVTAMVTKRDQVLAMAIERAVQRGESLDGLSSRKSDYQLGGRLHKRGGTKSSKQKTLRVGERSKTNRPASRGAPTRRQRR